MEAIILAGGLGTRLQSVVKNVPKPMAEIQGRPFLSYMLDYLESQGISRIILSVGYMNDVIRSYFGSSYRSMTIDYAIESKPLGTGGAIREALSMLEGDRAVVLNGDSLFMLDLRAFINFHCGLDSLLTLSGKPMHDYERYGSVLLEDSRVIGFEAKAFRSFGYINGGIYVMEKRMRHLFQIKEDAFSLEVDFLQKNTHTIILHAFKSNAYFIDIGIPEDYRKAHTELERAFGKATG